MPLPISKIEELPTSFRYSGSRQANYDDQLLYSPHMSLTGTISVDICIHHSRYRTYSGVLVYATRSHDCGVMHSRVYAGGSPP